MRRHSSVRNRIVLDGLIIVVLIAIAGTWQSYRSCRMKEIELGRRIIAMTGTQDSRLAADAIGRYHLPDGRDVVEILNETLESIGLSGTVMEMAPAAMTEPAADGTRGYPVHLRLAPVPGKRIADLLNAIEFQEPRLMIVTLQMTRIRSGYDAVDVTLELMGFRGEPLAFGHLPLAP